jgi:hypothetical protein
MIYLPLLNQVYSAIHTISPDAQVISCGGGGAGGGPGGAYIEPILAAGGADYQDGFSIHPYMSPPDPDTGYPTSGGATINAVNIKTSWEYLAGVIAANPRSDGKDLTMWATELGWPVVDGHVTELGQAQYVVRTYLLSRRYQTAQAVFWYDFQNDGTDPANMEHNFGLIRLDYSPKPAYVAMAVMADILRSRPFTEALIDGADTRAWRYGTGNDSVIAVWTADNTEKSIELNLNARAVALIDWQGRRQRILPNTEGMFRIPAGPHPGFLQPLYGRYECRMNR